MCLKLDIPDRCLYPRCPYRLQPVPRLLTGIDKKGATHAVLVHVHGTSQCEPFALPRYYLSSGRQPFMHIPPTELPGHPHGHSGAHVFCHAFLVVKRTSKQLEILKRRSNSYPSDIYRSHLKSFWFWSNL